MLWGEGPCYVPHKDMLVWSDIPNNRMLKLINNKVSEALNEHVKKSNHLPKDISEKSKEHEKGHQLNIANQTRGDSISLKTIEEETKKISLLNSLNIESREK